MSEKPRKIYWDSSCFICFLNKSESERRKICEDILRHASEGTLEIWTSTWTIVEVVRPKKTSLPKSRKLTPGEINKIEAMFKWKWIHKVQLDQLVAYDAVRIQRENGLKPADSIHAATAIRIKADALQRWDRDFDCVKHLITVEDPVMITQQVSLIPDYQRRIGPSPEDFDNHEDELRGQTDPRSEGPKSK